MVGHTVRGDFDFKGGEDAGTTKLFTMTETLEEVKGRLSTEVFRKIDVD
jgi:hypothetical protein